MRPRSSRLPRPSRESRIVLFCIVTLLLCVGLIIFAVPPAAVMGLMTWAILALCINACDVSEIAGRLLHVTAQLEESERNLNALRAESGRLSPDRATQRQRLSKLVSSGCEQTRGRAVPCRYLRSRPAPRKLSMNGDIARFADESDRGH
jgi:hypothetical protein